VFGPALPKAQAYASMLAGAGVERGLLGPGEAARIWDRHLLNCAAVVGLVPVPARLADLGSGAGLPGIVLALLLPTAQVMLVEPMARRTAFLEECVRELALPNVSVLRGRAEDMAGQIGADVVTSRAVAPLERLAVLAAGLARPGGLVLAIKGAAAAAEVSRAGRVLDQIGATGVEVMTVGADLVSPPTTVVRFRTAPRPVAGRARRARTERSRAQGS
jgi:16S rRNA (guanine527-N7)-methyltransferase